jgi:putative ABC transport system permease protein
MIQTLAAASLRRHPARTILAILGVAVAGALLLDMVMLGSGMRESFRRFLLVQGFQLRISPKGTLPMDTEATIDGASAILRTLRSNPDIIAITPVLGAQIHILQGTRATTSFAVGIDQSTEADYQLEAGTNVSAPDRIVANAAFLSRIRVRLGDTVDVVTGFDPQLRTYVGRRRLVLVGRGRFFYTSAEQPVAAVPLATMQAMGGPERADRVSLVLARVRDSANADSAAAWVDRTIPRVSTISTDAAMRQVDERMGYFRQLAVILAAVSLVVGFLLVTTLVTVSVNERLGEIAVMRAIGVRRVRVVQQIVLEGVALSFAGAVAGLGLGLVTARFLNAILSDFPGLPSTFHFFLFQPSAAVRSLGLLVVAGILAGIYPAWRAASLPIAGTLRREAIA